MNDNEPQDEDRITERRRLDPRVIAVAAVAALGIIAVLIWFLVLRGDSDEGQPVPAPRMTDNADTSAPAAETITLTAAQRQSAGIDIATVGEQLAADTAETAASTGVVEADAYRQTPAVSLVGGIVRRVVPVLGQNVTKGQTIAVVSSNEFAETQSRYVTLVTERENARRNYERTQRLVVINQPGRAEVEAATKQVTAANALLSEMQARHRRTTRLIQIGAASREELEQDTTKLRSAEAEAEEARLRLERANRLLTISPEARSANEEALNKLRNAESEAAAVREKLIVYGMPPSRVDALRSPSQVSAELAIPAPISGTVTSRTVNAGEVIDANKELLRVTDLSSVWVIAQVYERDLGRMRTGSGASVTTEAYPDRLFRGHITYIDPQLDEATRTGKVRVEIANGDRALRIGMYVKVAFGALGNAEQTAPAVPAAAVQTLNERQVVFVPTADPNTFEVRSVRVGPETNGLRQVLEGVTVGEQVVTNGSFLIRAEMLKQRILQ